MAPAPKSGTMAGTKKKPTDIPALTAELANPSPVTRRKARQALVAMGKPAVPSLIQLLSHRKPHARWEGAKALGAIADPIAASALVNALDDRDGDVRWLAAEGVAALGRGGLQPLLAALLQRAKSSWFCEGAHHVCHTLVKRKKLGPILRPVLAALNEPDRAVAAPPAAYAALSKLQELS